MVDDAFGREGTSQKSIVACPFHNAIRYDGVIDHHPRRRFRSIDTTVTPGRPGNTATIPPSTPQRRPPPMPSPPVHSTTCPTTYGTNDLAKRVFSKFRKCRLPNRPSRQRSRRLPYRPGETASIRRNRLDTGRHRRRRPRSTRLPWRPSPPNIYPTQSILRVHPDRPSTAVSPGQKGNTVAIPPSIPTAA